jgi:hypothetical protein
MEEVKESEKLTPPSIPDTKKDEAQLSKWRSRKWYVTLWCMFMVTGIVVFSYVTGNTDFNMLATTLAAEPIAYMSIQAIGKHKLQLKGQS